MLRNLLRTSALPPVIMCSVGVAHADISVTNARIGCLDIQKEGNLTELVGRACDHKTSCSYKAPTEDEYKHAGVKAATRNFCTQGMDITYTCGRGDSHTVSVDGDAWKHPPAELICGMVAVDRTSVQPPENERCSLPTGSPADMKKLTDLGYFIVPQDMVDKPADGGAYDSPPGHNIGANEGRVRAELRDAARRADPNYSLAWAMLNIAEGNVALGDAFADLSVTGHNSYAKFASAPPTEATIVDWARRQQDPKIKASIARFQDAALTKAAGEAIDRAYKVANMVREGRRDSPERRALGWVAVSGEDDEPYWPVNVTSTDFPQYELSVPVGYSAARLNITVRTRYMIAETKPPALPQNPSGGGAGRRLPPTTQPAIGDDAEILLYVHGMDSRAEEANDMANALVELGKARGKNFVLIAMDLPNSGYADKVDPRKISDIHVLGDQRTIPVVGGFDFDAHGQHNAPLLDFIEDFIVSFVDTLDRRTPVKSKIKAIIGGSLGGNMTLRLGRRPDVPWLKTVVPWSPGSIWNSLADGDDLTKHLAVLTGWQRAGGDPNNFDEQEADRKNWFSEAFDQPIGILSINIVPAQPYMWYRADWPCLPSAVVADRIDRQEVYNSTYRLDHWRLGTEQLIYSHQAKDASGKPLYMRDDKPMLLACGQLDKFNYSDICPSTQTVASQMTNTPGKAQFLGNTGHSIHNERPVYWTEQIVEFLGM